MLVRVALALVVLLGAAPTRAAGPAPASPASAGPSLSTDDLKALVKTLENDAERQRFVAQLKALVAAREQLAAAQPPTPESLGARVITALSEEIQRVSTTLVGAAGVLVDLPDFFAWAKRQATDPDQQAAWAELAIKLVIVLGLAFLAERLAGILMRRPHRTIQDRVGDSLWLRATLLFARILLDLVPIAVFGAVAYGVLPFTRPGPLARLLTLVIVNASVIVRAVLATGRALLAPQAPILRLLAMSAETASYWLVWLRRLVGLSVYGYFAAEAALLVGLPRAAYEALVKIIGLVVVALVMILVLQNRQIVARWIRGVPHEGTPAGLRVLRARLAEIWHILALLYLAAIYAVWVLRIAGGFEFILRASALSVLIILAARAVAAGGAGLIERFFAIGADLKKRFPALEQRADRYLPVLIRAFRFIISLFAFFALLQVWGAGGLDWLTSGIGRALLGSVATIAITVVIAVAIWEAISILIELYLARHAVERQGAYRRVRAHTLLPLLRKAISIFIGAVAALIVLSAIGINIAPLLAGAGVVGIAVGFGAQTLVKDLITGLFIVIEDTIAVGDVVSIGSESGVVESISIRSIRLRDGNGAVHTIPFSEVTRVINQTKDYAYAVFNIAIGYREDIDRVIQAITALGAELKADPAFGPDILEPIEVAGLDRFGDFAVILNSRIKTLPGKQWGVAREFNRRLKCRFDELGIRMPLPSHMVYLTTDKEGGVPSLGAALADPASTQAGGAEAGGREQGGPMKAALSVGRADMPR